MMNILQDRPAKIIARSLMLFSTEVAKNKLDSKYSIYCSTANTFTAFSPKAASIRRATEIEHGYK